MEGSHSLNLRCPPISRKLVSRRRFYYCSEEGNRDKMGRGVPQGGWALFWSTVSHIACRASLCYLVLIWQPATSQHAPSLRGSHHITKSHRYIQLWLGFRESRYKPKNNLSTTINLLNRIVTCAFL